MEKKLPKPPQEFSIDDVAYLYTPPPTPSNIILLIPASYPSAPPPSSSTPVFLRQTTTTLSHLSPLTLPAPWRRPPRILILPSKRSSRCLCLSSGVERLDLRGMLFI